MTPQIDCTDVVTGGGSDCRGATTTVDKADWRVPSGGDHSRNLRAVSFSGKPELTHCKLTVCKIVGMDDQEWLYLEEPWQRLRWARMHWQRSIGSATTGKAASEALGFNTPEGYTAYEREPGASRHTPLSAQRAIQFGRKFKINWVWILEGKGTPFDVPTSGLSPAQSKMVAMLADLPEEEQERVVQMVELARGLKAS